MAGEGQVINHLGTAAAVLAALNGNATIALTAPVTIANTLATTGAITVDTGSGSLPGSEPSAIVGRFFSADASSPRLFGEAFGASGLTVSGRAIGGTRASPTATPANTNLLSLTGLGYDGTSYTTAGASVYNQIATTLWTASNHETHHQWRTTPNGSTTVATTLELHHGRLLLGSTLPTDDGSTALQVNGAATIQSTTASSSSATGAIVVSGGVGVAKDVRSAQAILSSGPTNGIGYATGAGGTVAQSTSKSTGVTLNTVCGTITLNAAALASATAVAFTFTNSAIAATDSIDIQHESVGTLGGYTICVTPASGSATVTVRNITAGSLSEALVLKFFVKKAVTA